MEKIVHENSYQKMTVVILSVLILFLGGSYAWLTLSLKGEKTSSVIVGNLSLELKDDKTEGILIENAYPVDDEVGINYNPYSFTLSNTGTLESNYTIYLDDASLPNGNTRMNENFIKFNLVKNGIRESSKFLKDTKTAQGRVIDSGTLAVGQKNEYDLRLWIDVDTTNAVMNTTFSGAIRVEAEQIKE